MGLQREFDNDNRFKGLLIALLVAAFAVYILWTRRSAKDK